MKTHLSPFVDSGEVPGFVALVSRDGQTDVEVAGTRTRGGGPLARDAIFRITSMTKPITAAATLRLAEQGKLRLEDPVTRWLPELARRRVLARIDGPLDETVPARREITVEDVLTFRMGFGMILDFSKPYPIVDEFGRLGLLGLGPPDPSSPITPEEWLQRFATLPLMTQPGEAWLYNTAYYLLGVLLSRVTGQKLDKLLEECVFQPLGMKDTGFVVPEDKLHRLTDCYWFDSENQRLEIHDAAESSIWSREPSFLDAAAGLVSTADDYHRFARMLLDRGRHEGRAFLSEESVEAMTRDHLTLEQRAHATLVPDQWKNHGYGFGVSVRTARADDLPGHPGQYGWNGGFGSTWLNDPAAGLTGILLCERTFDSPALPPICLEFWKQAYEGA